jgi:hypothetical protein
LYGGTEVDGVEGSGRQVLGFVLVPLASNGSLPVVVVAPEVGPAVGVRDVQQSDSLKCLAVG